MCVHISFGLSRWSPNASCSTTSITALKSYPKHQHLVSASAFHPSTMLDLPFNSNFLLLIMGVGLSSSCQWISCLYCLWVLFFFGASSCSSSSPSLLHFSKICCIPLKGHRTTSSGWRSVSNHLSRLGPQMSHWPGNKSYTGGSGVGVLLLGSLSLGRAKICVMGVNEGCRSPNWRMWVMVWEGLCGNR